MTTDEAIRYIECMYFTMKINNNESQENCDTPVDRNLEHALEKTIIAAKANILINNTINKEKNNG